MPKKKIRAIVESRSIDGGHAIELDIELSDGSKETLECPQERAALLVHAITNAAVVAERMRQAAPGTVFSVEVPYYATGVRTGTSADNQFVVVLFPTKGGQPVQIAMTRDIARTAIEQLSNELDQLGRQQPLKPS